MGKREVKEKVRTKALGMRKGGVKSGGFWLKERVDKAQGILGQPSLAGHVHGGEQWGGVVRDVV